MTDLRNSIVMAHLAKRVVSTRPKPAPVTFADTPIPEGLHNYLKDHLASGETHYTARPGITELRQSVGRKLGGLGGPERDADGVIVTQGEGEALYVTLLGLGIGAESTIAVAGDCAHLGLLRMLGIEAVGADDPKASGASACFCGIDEKLGGNTPPVPDGCFEILALGDLLFSKRSLETDLSIVSHDTILIGHLDSLPGLDHFRMGYVAGPPDLVKRIQTWKQALSICSAAPSQRAALFAISRERTS